MFDNANKQNIADRLKKILLAAARGAEQQASKRDALETLQKFENGTWNSAAFTEAFGIAEDFAMKGNGEIIYTGNGDPWNAVEQLLNAYAALITPRQAASQDAPQDYTFTMEEAAEYVGVSVPTMKRYYHTQHLIPGKIRAGSLFFAQRDLDWLKANRPPRGQPRKVAE